MVTGLFLLFEGRVLLVFHPDEPGGAQRGEDR
jgi:hypothetical protein